MIAHLILSAPYDFQTIIYSLLYARTIYSRLKYRLPSPPPLDSPLAAGTLSGQDPPVPGFLTGASSGLTPAPPAPRPSLQPATVSTPQPPATPTTQPPALPTTPPSVLSTPQPSAISTPQPTPSLTSPSPAASTLEPRLPTLPGLPAIPPSMLANIRAGKYIDLASLLPEALAVASFTGPASEGKDKDSKGDKPPSATIRTPVDWALAFSTFAALFAQGTPERAPSLMTYMAIILRMARQGRPGMWSRYDRAFRQAAALDPTLQWDRRETDIWLSALSEDNMGPPLPPGRLLPPPAMGIPDTSLRPVPEICIRWNRGTCIPPCRYTHRCMTCHDPRHAARDCPRSRPPARRPSPY